MEKKKHKTNEAKVNIKIKVENCKSTQKFMHENFSNFSDLKFHLWEFSSCDLKLLFERFPVLSTFFRWHSWVWLRCWLSLEIATAVNHFPRQNRPWNQEIMSWVCQEFHENFLTFCGLIWAFDCAVVPRLVGSVKSSSSSGPPSTNFCLSIDLSSHSILDCLLANLYSNFTWF